MNIQESKIHLSLYEQGGFKPRFDKDGKRILCATPGPCTRKVTLGPDFIAEALKNPEPAFKLKVLGPTAKPKEYHKLTTNMKLHLHVKQFVADSFGVDFGGNLKCFDWQLI